MNAPNLFDDEQKVIAWAEAIHQDISLPTEKYWSALGGLLQHYAKLVRMCHRLIKKSDRWEREINILNKELTLLKAELQYKAEHDSLTGIFNRGAVFQRATNYLRSTSLAIVLIDIDFFKKINDEFGHPRGDAVLRELVFRLSQALRATDVIGRIGGEEFTVLLPDTTLQDGLVIAREMCTLMAHHPFASMSGKHVTASFGVSWGACGTSVDALYLDADNALYAAKHNGRNRVEISAVSATRIAESWSHFSVRSRVREATEE